REICRALDADLRVRRRHRALGCGDVGPALKQLRRHDEGHRGNARVPGRNGDVHLGRRLAGQERDRMLEPLTLPDHRDEIRLRRLEQRDLVVRLAQREVVGRERSLRGQARRGEVGGARLRARLCTRHCQAQLAPDVGLPACGEIEVEARAPGLRAPAAGTRRGTVQRQRGKERGTLLADEGLRLHVRGNRRGDVLVGHFHLPDQRAERRIAEELPPRTAVELVGGRRREPRRIGGGRLLVGGRLGGARTLVGRRKRACRQRGKCCTEQPRGPAMHFAHLDPDDAFSALAPTRLRWRSSALAGRSLSSSRYTTGVVSSVSNWLATSPPMIATPSGWRSSAPSPKPIASGSATKAAASVVIRIGRKRSRHASRTASRELKPRARSASSAKSMIRIAFFFTMPISRNTPISAISVKSIRKSSSASTAPTPADGSVDSTVIGCTRLSYSTPSTM